MNGGDGIVEDVGNRRIHNYLKAINSTSQCGLHLGVFEHQVTGLDDPGHGENMNCGGGGGVVMNTSVCIVRFDIYQRWIRRICASGDFVSWVFGVRRHDGG